YQRLGHFNPVPLPGGVQAIKQPWRNTFSQLNHSLGWQNVAQQWGDLEPVKWLQQHNLEVLAKMVNGGINSPMSSSCGRLFDGVAGLLNICRDEISYEGQAAIELESAAQLGRCEEDEGYRLNVMADNGVGYLDAQALWLGLLHDLREGLSTERIAWRFHNGLAISICEMATGLARPAQLDTIALSGGVFQNKTLSELVSNNLTEQGFRVLSHRQVPSNDGGLALGQAAIGAAVALA
ncbi:MAG: carbamoyltransferase HypF, partial [Candidatus Thiodiazotropha sp.]